MKIIIEYITWPFKAIIFTLIGIVWLLFGKESRGGANIGEFDEFDE